MTSNSTATVSTIKTPEQVKGETTRRTVSTLLTLAGISPVGATLTETEIAALVSAMRPMLASYSKATSGEVATTEMDRKVLARLDSYFGRKGWYSTDSKGNATRNTLDKTILAEMVDMSDEAVKAAIDSSDSRYRFFRGDSIGLTDKALESMIAGKSEERASSPALEGEKGKAKSLSAKDKGNAVRLAAKTG